MVKYAGVLSIALIGLLGFKQLGAEAANVLHGQAEAETELSLAAGASNRWVTLPSLVSRVQAGVGGALGDIAYLARRVVRGSTPASAVPGEIAQIAQRSAKASVFDEISQLAKQLPDEEWRPRLIHGLDPDTPWRDLDIVSVDLEGIIGEPTQIGLVQISRRELGNEITIRMTPSSGESTKKATRLRLLDSTKEVSEAAAFGESLSLFKTFSEGRVPLAFQHQGDLQGLMHEWSLLENPGRIGIYVVEPEIEWIDVANWGRMFAFGTKNNLGALHWRVVEESLSGAHVGVNDARGAARVLFRLAEDHPEMPATYGELVKHQVAWRKFRGQVEELQEARLETAIEAEALRLTDAFEEELKLQKAKRRSN